MTQRGQLALAVLECTLLTKTLRPPPDKHHGLGDTGTRYRYRELDLIANDETRELFVTRARIVAAIREWLDERNFVEVETPALQSLAGGAGSRPFTTHHNALDRDLYLRISVELFLNRCIVGGLENVYDMGKVFRNEGISPSTAPSSRSSSSCLRMPITTTWQRQPKRCSGTWPSGPSAGPSSSGTVKRSTWPSHGSGLRCAKRSSRRPVSTSWSRGPRAATQARGARGTGRPGGDLGGGRADIYTKLIEPTINQPTHVFDFPLEPFPITKRHAVHPELAEHFDAVIGGIELVSGDTELNDPVDQWQRFVDQRKRRMIDDEDVPHPNDEEYARAIEYGYSPTAGGGMGVDRLVMILTERDTLREVIPFPIVRDVR